jgi:hypothetical protein
VGCSGNDLKTLVMVVDMFYISRFSLVLYQLASNRAIRIHINCHACATNNLVLMICSLLRDSLPYYQPVPDDGRNSTKSSILCESGIAEHCGRPCF